MDPSTPWALVSSWADVAQLALGVSTLYIVARVTARFAVVEFKVDQMWRWYHDERRRPGDSSVPR